MTLKTLIIPAVLTITLAACGPTATTSSPTPQTSSTSTAATNTSTSTTTSSPTTSTSSSSQYSLADLKSHNSSSDCWMAIDGKVYNVTSYIDQHPGGMMITMGCGKDASTMFHTMGKHGGRAPALLPEFYLGDLKS